MDVALTDDTKALAKDGFKEEAAGGTAGADKLFDVLVATEGQGGLFLVNIIQQLLSQP